MIPIGLAFGLGLGAIAEVAKKSLAPGDKSGGKTWLDIMVQLIVGLVGLFYSSLLFGRTEKSNSGLKPLHIRGQC